ncbi:MAG: sialidase family protein [Spirosomataceae bacterium]
MAVLWLIGCLNLSVFAHPFADETRAFLLPTLAQNPKGDVVLSWAEKDAKGMMYFFCAISKDKGKTFSDKKLIFSGAGFGSSRLMRPKLLFKKDGTMVAVFSHRTEVAAVSQATGEHNHDSKPTASERPKRDLQIVYTTSKDQGNTWTPPQPVDIEPRSGIVRGFFDAVVLPNDELAVAYLKDVAGSTKHEERDLRLAITKNGLFQPDRVIDAVVCDCCNISLLVDSKGGLNIYYRDNNDDIRDIAKMTSSNNGATFSKSQILYNDNWQIKGCPHSGATSSLFGESALIAWFSGTNSNTAGIRVVTHEGKRLFVLESSAKNAYLLPASKSSVLLWEQLKGEENNTTSIAFRTITTDGVSETKWIEKSENGTNASGLVVDNQLMVAYEVKQPNNLNSMKITTVGL